MKKEGLLKFYLHYRLYIFPAVAVVSSLILIIFVIYPQAVKLLTNQKLEQDLSKKGAFLEEKAQALESYDTADLSEKIKYVLSSYPTDKDFANAVGVLQNLMAQAGFNIVSLSLGGSSGKEAKLQSYSVKLDLLGPLRFLPVLLSNIEGSPRLMRVSGIETTVGKDEASATITLNIEVLYSEAPSGFGTVDSPLTQLSQKDEEVLAALASSGVSQLEATAAAAPRGKSNPFE